MKNKVLAMFLILTMLSLGVKTYATTISDYHLLIIYLMSHEFHLLMNQFLEFKQI